MQNIELADGGILLYDEAFLPADLADRYFAELRDTAPWEQKKAAFGHLQPRLTASYGDDGVTYFYSGTKNTALPWTPTLLEMCDIAGRVNVVGSGEHDFSTNPPDLPLDSYDRHAAYRLKPPDSLELRLALSQHQADPTDQDSNLAHGRERRRCKEMRRRRPTRERRWAG